MMKSRIVRGSIVLGLGVAALVLDPSALVLADPGFNYSDAQLRPIAEGTWMLTRGDKSTTLLISEASAPEHAERERAWVREAGACGHRTMVRSAHACVDWTEMPLDVRAVSGELAGAHATGTLRAYGAKLDSAVLQIELEVAGTSYGARVSRTGHVLHMFDDTGLLEHLAAAK